ncbi:T4SS effector SidA family protein [Legionella parisiensis]|uniref:SidA protein, subsrate of the Dot/Icm transport system n=1 Tax=Legionella parisiensis TaxID=45071 RepID=A0A1E5JRZ9_9GAMM|nr:T4SS effector SidA family protein [Legionella parisiensis]KTD41067.1 SidA protein, substrate of the Dot/Icm transport system [Legionella parisiensis]OEH47285.1 hypothetical protein lpari_01767 [Legionella parisiensis]STX76640.1 SidA [Legionella parisiensis]
MTYPRKKHVILSEEMDDLKKRINQRKKEQKSYIEIVNKKATLSQRLLEGVQKFWGLIAAIFSASKELPVFGFVFQMLAVFPNAVKTLTDKNSSIGSKVFATFLLLSLTALGITAFVMGGIIAAKIGLAIACTATALEAISFIGSLFNKHNTRTAYKGKKEFAKLLDEETKEFSHLKDLSKPYALENDKYRERLEFRALELEHLLEKSTNESLKEELAFINIIRNKKPYVAPSTDSIFLRFINKIRSKIGLSELPADDPPVIKLSKLYQDRKDLVSYLAKNTELIDTKYQDSNSSLITLVGKLQQQIAQIDKDIESITEPLHELKRNDLLANEAIAKSFTNLALGGAGVTLSLIALMILPILLSAVVAPPIVATVSTILLGFGIGLAIFGAVKWVMELRATRKDEKIMRERTKEHEEIILEEALYEYDHCSYSVAMRPLLNSKPEELQHPAANDVAITSEPSDTESLSPLNSSDVTQSGEFQI